MPISLVQELVVLLQDNLYKGTIAPFMQVLIALRFFATGSYQRGVAQDYKHPASQPTISRIIDRITRALVSISDQWVRFPQSKEERQALKTR